MTHRQTLMTLLVVVHCVRRPHFDAGEGLRGRFRQRLVCTRSSEQASQKERLQELHQRIDTHIPLTHAPVEGIHFLQPAQQTFLLGGKAGGAARR